MKKTGIKIFLAVIVIALASFSLFIISQGLNNFKHYGRRSNFLSKSIQPDFFSVAILINSYNLISPRLLKIKITPQISFIF